MTSKWAAGRAYCRKDKQDWLEDDQDMLQNEQERLQDVQDMM
jgi:hypothetical protein